MLIVVLDYGCKFAENKKKTLFIVYMWDLKNILGQCFKHLLIKLILF